MRDELAVNELTMVVVAVVVDDDETVCVVVATVTVMVAVAPVLENMVEVVEVVLVPTVEIVVKVVEVDVKVEPTVVKRNIVEDGPVTGELIQRAPNSKLLQKVLSRVRTSGSMNVQITALVGLLTQIEVVMVHNTAIADM